MHIRTFIILTIVSLLAKPTSQGAQDCFDSHRFCAWWSSEGYCTSMWLFEGQSVTDLCPKACNLCGANGNDDVNAGPTSDTTADVDQSSSPAGVVPSSTAGPAHLSERDMSTEQWWQKLPDRVTPITNPGARITDKDNGKDDSNGPDDDSGKDDSNGPADDNNGDPGDDNNNGNGPDDDSNNEHGPGDDNNNNEPGPGDDNNDDGQGRDKKPDLTDFYPPISDLPDLGNLGPPAPDPKDALPIVQPYAYCEVACAGVGGAHTSVSNCEAMPGDTLLCSMSNMENYTISVAGLWKFATAAEEQEQQLMRSKQLSDSSGLGYQCQVSNGNQCGGSTGNACSGATYNPSALYGCKGEVFNTGPGGRVLPWGHTGFYGNSRPIPKLDPLFNAVTDFGLVGDGVTDNWPAFSTMLNVVRTRNWNWAGQHMESRATVFLPEGNYLVSRHLSTTTVLLQGAGVGKTIINYTTTFSDLRGLLNNAENVDFRWGAYGMYTIGGNDDSTAAFTVARVTANARRGDSILVLSDLTNIMVGSMLRVMVFNTSATDYSPINDLYGMSVTDPIAPAYRILPPYYRWPFFVVNRFDHNNSILIDPPLPFNISTAWNPTINPSTRGFMFGGLEDLSIVLPDKPFVNSASNAGGSALYLFSISNSWFRNLEIVNADLGIQLSNVYSCTFANITFRDTGRRATSNALTETGFMGFYLKQQGSNNFANINFDKTFVRDVSFESFGMMSTFNAIRARAFSVELKYWGAYGNLFSNIDVGNGRKFFGLGGFYGRVNFSAAAYNTFWNVYSSANVSIRPRIQALNPTLRFAPVNFVNVTLDPRIGIAEIDDFDGQGEDMSSWEALAHSFEVEDSTQPLRGYSAEQPWPQGDAQGGQPQRGSMDAAQVVAARNMATTGGIYWNETVANLGPPDLVPALGVQALQTDFFAGLNGAPYGCMPNGDKCFFDGQEPACGDGALGAASVWGCNGELYAVDNPVGHLTDFRYAGIINMWTETPTWNVTANVLDFGALPNDDVPDTEAFIAAMAAMPTPGFLYIPAGQYLLDGMLNISRNGIALKGDGPDLSVLTFIRSLTDITGRSGVGRWSYNPALINLKSGWSGIRPATHASVIPITANASVGESAITVANAASFSVGQMIIITQDDVNGNLLRSLWGDGVPIENPLSPFIGTPRVTYLNGRSLTRFYANITSIDGNVLRLNRRFMYPISTAFVARVQPFRPENMWKGVQDLTVNIPPTPYQSHLREDGWNAIFLEPGLVNSWVRNVNIYNVDLAVTVYGTFCTVRDVVVDNTARWELALKSNYSMASGHYALQFGFGDHMLGQGITTMGHFMHDISYYGFITNSVIRKVKCWDCAVDFHRHFPSHDLITDINLGNGTRGLVIGGTEDTGTAFAAHMVLWNLGGVQRPRLPNATFFGPNAIMEGFTTLEWMPNNNRYKWLVENNQGVYPRDLYQAQVDLWGVAEM